MAFMNPVQSLFLKTSLDKRGRFDMQKSVELTCTPECVEN